MRGGRRQHEHGVRRRLLQCLQEGVPGRRRELVREYPTFRDDVREAELRWARETTEAVVKEADDLRARTFEWSAFSARRFPDRDRHDLVALAAYGKYRAGMDAPAPLGADAARLRL